MPYLIYKATSPSGKSYIGLTSQSLSRRKYQHFGSAKRGAGSAFQNCLRKYGDQVVWEVLEQGLVSFEQASEREIFYINQFQTYRTGKGYNCTRGGDVGRPLQTSEKEMFPVKRSDGIVFSSARAATKALGFTGRREAVGKAMRRGGVCCGFSFVRITVAEYQEVMKGQTHQNEDFTCNQQRGFRHTTETKQKLSEMHKRVGHSDTHRRNRLAAIQKKVICSDGAVFPSMTHAAEAFGVSRQSITYSIKQGYPRSGITFAFEGGLS